MGSNIIQIIISIIIIIMGLSGQYVLRGTNSSGWLVAVGVGWLLFYIGKVIVQKRKEPKYKVEKKPQHVIERAEAVKRAVNESTERLPYSKKITLINTEDYGKSYIVMLNQERIGMISKEVPLTFYTEKLKNSIYLVDHVNQITKEPIFFEVIDDREASMELEPEEGNILSLGLAERNGIRQLK